MIHQWKVTLAHSRIAWIAHMPDHEEVTRLLKAISAGNKDARNELLPRVYEQLKSMARLHMRRERDDHTLQTTALVHEAYLRLGDQADLDYENRFHFFQIAAEAMRRVLVDHARSRKAQKRGQGKKGETLDEDAAQLLLNSSTDILDLDSALNDLADFDGRMAQVVELRFFGGLNVEETAQVMKISPRTVISEWRLARAWLKEKMD